jgi:hypothetical protein
MPDLPADESVFPEPAAELHRDASLLPRPASSALRILRLVALVGTAAALLWQATSLAHIKPRQEIGFLVLLAAFAAVAATLWFVLSRATGMLLRHKDLLLPLGLLVPAEALWSTLLTIPALAAVVTAAWPVKIPAFQFALSLALLVQILLSIVYAGWTTKLILQAVTRDQVDPLLALASFGKWWWRVLLIEFIGWGVLFLGVTVAVALGTVVPALALILIGVLTLLWNLATAALLPVALVEDRPFGEALRAGFRISWRSKRRWWVPVVVQMVLLGWLTYIHISYTSSPGPGSITTHTKTNWSVNGFWTGGYENSCRWHSKLMETVEAQPLPLIEGLLAILFAVLAIAVKLRIVTEIYPPVSPAGEDRTNELPQGEPLA